MSYTEYLIGLKPNTTLKAPPVVSYFQVTFFPGYLNYVKVAKLVITAITHLRIEELGKVIRTPTLTNRNILFLIPLFKVVPD